MRIFGPDPRDTVIAELKLELEQSRLFMGRQNDHLIELQGVLAGMHKIGKQALEDGRQHDLNVRNLELEALRIQNALDVEGPAPGPAGEPADLSAEVPGGDEVPA